MMISQKTGYQPTSRHSYTTRIYPKVTISYHKETCSTMFIVASLIIATKWKQPRCPTTEEWIKKMWYIYTMKYYSTVKKITP